MTTLKLKNQIALSLIFLCSGLVIQAQELIRPVVTGAPFLQVVPDARSGGMGETGVATLSDAYAQFHNPAKFLFFGAETRGIGLSYIPQFTGYAKDIFLGNASYFQKFNERSALSGSLTYFNYGEVNVEDEINNQIIQQGTFNPNELALDLSYSLLLNEHFGMAVTARYIRSDITTNNANSNIDFRTGNAISADISGYYDSNPGIMTENKWTLGFSLKNMGSKLSYAEEEEYSYPLPTSLKLGGGYHIASGKNDVLSLYAEALKFLVSATDDQRNLPDDSAVGGWFRSFGDAPDGFSEEMKEVLVSLGAEMNFNQALQLRLGYITQSEEKGFRKHMSIGAGMMLDRFHFDFAYQLPVANDIASNKDRVLKFSMSFNLNASQKKSTASAVVGTL